MKQVTRGPGLCVSGIAKRTLAVLGSACTFLAVGVVGQMLLPTSAQATACYTAWVSTTAYSGGATVSYNNVNYTAAFWSQGSNPSTNNGGSGTGEPWVSDGACTTTTGSTTGTCSAVPSAPATPTASGTTTTTTNLAWTAVTPPANCTISSYEVYKNGTALASVTSGTSYSVTGLTASTAYTFTVAAVDAFGTGSQSSGLSVTTSSASCAAAPSAPATPTASGTTSTSTNIAWTAVTPPANCTISSYEVYKNGTALASVTSGTSYSVTGLTASTAYTFTVAAVDAFGTGSQSSGLSVTTSSASCAAAPSAPATPTASGTTSTSTNIAWTAVTPPANCTISSYEVYKNGTALASVTSGTSYSATGLTASTAYTFTVAAVDAFGTSSQSSGVSVTTSSSTTGTTTGSTSGGINCTGVAAWSANSVAYTVGELVTYNGSEYTCLQANTSQAGWNPTVQSLWTDDGACAATTGSTTGTTTGSTTSSTTGSCTAVPSAPATPTASGTTSSSTGLSWTAVTPPANCTISSYEVYENGTALASVSSGTSYTVSGLAASTTYKFTIAAIDSDGTGAQSASVSVTTSASTSCTATPSAPSTPTASNTTSTGTTLTWTAVTPPTNCTITSYTVYQSGTALATGITGTSYTITGLASSTAYTFTVAAIDSAGAGSQSSAVNVTTLAAGSCSTLPAQVGGLQATSPTYMGFTLAWTAVTTPSGCSTPTYTVFQNGTAIATGVTTAGYIVSNLTPSTAYTFTVSAVDGAGTGPVSGAVNATTQSEGVAGNGKMILAGYWDNWGGGEPYVPLNQVDPGYDIVIIAFAVGPGGPNTSGPDVAFAPLDETPAQIVSDVNYLHSKGRKVLLSIGGETGNIILNDAADATSFVNDVKGILAAYPFDGIDLDIENGNISLASGDTNLANPSTPQIQAWISALGQLHTALPNMMLTFAPETYYLQEGYSTYAGVDGSQLAIINATRSWLSYVWPQDYESGNLTGLDGNSYAMGDADFTVMATEFLLQGFPCASGAGTFAALSQKQVCIGTPSETSAANGYIAPSVVESAMSYLDAGTADGGSYKLRGGPYPNIGGIMTFSMSWDYYSNYAFVDAIRPYLNNQP